jgi:hypothetical protein
VWLNPKDCKGDIQKKKNVKYEKKKKRGILVQRKTKSKEAKKIKK